MKKYEEGKETKIGEKRIGEKGREEGKVERDFILDLIEEQNHTQRILRVQKKQY